MPIYGTDTEKLKILIDRAEKLQNNLKQIETEQFKMRKKNDAIETTLIVAIIMYVVLIIGSVVCLTTT